MSFQLEEYTPPTWPQPPATEHMMMRCTEVAVDDLDSAVEHALACGARRADGCRLRTVSAHGRLGRMARLAAGIDA